MLLPVPVIQWLIFSWPAWDRVILFQSFTQETQTLEKLKAFMYSLYWFFNFKIHEIHKSHVRTLLFPPPNAWLEVSFLLDLWCLYLLQLLITVPMQTRLPFTVCFIAWWTSTLISREWRLPFIGKRLCRAGKELNVGFQDLANTCSTGSKASWHLLSARYTKLSITTGEDCYNSGAEISDVPLIAS